jgi:hypothetical protein
MCRMSRIAGVAVWAFVACLATGCGSRQDQGTNAKAGRIDPEPYRGDLEAAEAVLYKDAPASYSDGDQVSAALYRAASRAMAASGDPVQQEKARVLVAFAGEAGAVEDAGYALPDLGSLRARWCEVRAEVFRDADWFREADTGLESRQHPPRPRASAGDVHDVGKVVDRLSDLIRKGRRQAEDLGEPIYALEMIDRAGEVQIAHWQAWSRQWDEKLTDLARQLPPAPGLDDNGHYLLAYQNVAQAIADLRRVPSGAGAWPTPFRYQWERCFELAEQQLTAARQHLDQTF